MGEFAFFWRAIRVVARIPFVRRLGWEVHVEGREHVPDEGAVLAFNHQGHQIRPRRGIPVVIRYCEPVVPRPQESVPALVGRLQTSMGSALDGVQRDDPDVAGPDDDWWVPGRLGGSAPEHAAVVAAHQARFRAGRSRRDDDAAAS